MCTIMIIERTFYTQYLKYKYGCLSELSLTIIALGHRQVAGFYSVINFLVHTWVNKLMTHLMIVSCLSPKTSQVACCYPPWDMRSKFQFCFITEISFSNLAHDYWKIKIGIMVVCTLLDWQYHLLLESSICHLRFNEWYTIQFSS